MSPAQDQGPGIKVNRRTYSVIWDDLLVPGMTGRAWGIFCYLMSRPPGWEARASHLQTVFKEGRDAMYAVLNELCDLGLMTKEVRFEGNLKRVRFLLDEDVLNDNPRVRSRRSARETASQDLGGAQGDATAGSPRTGSQYAEAPRAEKPGQVSTEGPTTDGTSTERKNTAAAVAPSGGLSAAVVESTGTIPGQEVALFGKTEVAPKAASPAKREPEPTFADFWAKYPKRVDKGHAETAWGQMLRKGARPSDMIAGLDRFNEKLARDPLDPKYIPYPATWLRGKRYEDSDEEMAAAVLDPRLRERRAMEESWLDMGRRLDEATARRDEGVA